LPEIAAAGAGDGARSLRCAAVPSLRHLVHGGDERIDGMLRVADLLDEGAAHERVQAAAIAAMERHVEPHDAANIQFTSGTTGAPKGATLSHHNVLNNGYFVGRAQALTRHDRVCVPVPLYHCFGIVMGNLAALTH